MANLKDLALFDQQSVRRFWDEEKELWWFSIIDVILILTNSSRSRKYWNDLKTKLQKEGSELSEKIGQLKMLANDGKKYLTDCADTETMLRLIQSIPSSKAEPLKLWLAQVGYERLEETADPELAFERAMQTYLRKGYSKEWINQRLKSIKEYKKFKGLKKESLRDNMSNLEIVLNMLAEVSTTEISKKQQPSGLKENKVVAKKGGHVAGIARKEIECQTGQNVVTTQNAKQLQVEKKLLKKV